MEYCLFHLSRQTYAVPLSYVREVLIRPVVTPVPLAPPLLKGMTGFRGEVLPVFTIDTLLHSGDALPSDTERSRVLVLSHNETFFGILVDQVSRAEFSQDEMPIPDQEDEALSREFVINKNTIHLMNPAKLHAGLAASFNTTQPVF